MRVWRAVAVLLGIALSTLPRAADPPTWLPADPDHRWSFPRDHHAHPAQRTEWWYLTGTLRSADAPARRFGYQLTFFRQGIARTAPALDSAWAAGDAVMAHLAITDLDRGVHVFSEVLWRAAPGLGLGGFGGEGDPVLAWARAPPGTAGRWSLRLTGDDAFALAAADDARGVAIALSTAPERPRVLQGPNGYHRKSDAPGHASLYYSLTRLATVGTLTAGGRTYQVSGTSWLDRELGSSPLAAAQVGWDWWSLRLGDGRDLMLYVLRRADGSADHRSATVVEADGAVRLLTPAEWTVEALGTWRSPRTGAVYPAGWRLEIPREGIVATIRPEVPDAENVSARLPNLVYWEGPVRLAGPGGATGEGYAELTGYGPGARPPI
jgi:predicted secreted hydrolase